MNVNATHHGTVVVEQRVEAALPLVYAAFADHKAREAWGAPSASAAFFYDEADFRVGGRDIARCGAKDDPKFVVESRYVDIIPEQRIVWTETIREIDKFLAANITTLGFKADEEWTLLTVTVQVTSFAGEGMIENTRAGQVGSLANLARYCETPRTS